MNGNNLPPTSNGKKANGLLLNGDADANDSGNGSGNGNGSIIGIRDGFNGCENGGNGDDDEPESLQYLKPANDDLTIAYSEGTQKTDLLY